MEVKDNYFQENDPIEALNKEELIKTLKNIYA
jgi:hypothetical protein